MIGISRAVAGRKFIMFFFALGLLGGFFGSLAGRFFIREEAAALADVRKKTSLDQKNRDGSRVVPITMISKANEGSAAAAAEPDRSLIGDRIPFGNRTAPELFEILSLNKSWEKLLARQELERAKSFGEYVFENASSAVLVTKRPLAEEWDELMKETLSKLSSHQAAIAGDPAVESMLKERMKNFYDFDHEYRYIGFILSDERAFPTLVTMESSKFYEKDEIKNVPESEWVFSFEDLKPGSKSMQRYGEFFHYKD